MDRPGEPISLNKSGSSVDDELGPIFGEIPDPPSDVKYQYDYMATIKRTGRERMDRFYRDKNPLPDPLVPESI